MKDQDKTRVQSLLDQTRRLSVEQREGHLREACKGDEDLYEEVTLRLSDENETLRLGEEDLARRHAAFVDIRIGDQIGPYRLTAQLGEGGMGMVFLAEQSRPVIRRVALKVIKLGMDTREVISRFESERQALAMMNHPNVAAALDAGSTESGRPFFIMEYVDGVPINEYCDNHRMTLIERLKLFAQACQGVQHAHQKGIIHRDLKPNNILVTHVGPKPLVKIIDFGIAKSTDHKLAQETFYTQLGVFVGTPNYMSPEQVGNNPFDIDTRTDVYSLGVLLYELLTGSLPFEDQAFESMSTSDIQRVIRELDPPTPADRLRGIAPPALRKLAKRRQLDEASLKRRLRGELSWIVMHAMDKDRGHRYRSAAAVSEDIDRFLRSEPVEAVPRSQMYRLRKFISRHKIMVVSGLTVALALLGGLLVSGWALLQAERARAEAQRLADISAATNAVLYDLFVPDTSDAAGAFAGRSIDDSIALMLGRLNAGTAFAGPDFVDVSTPEALSEVERRIRQLVADREAVMNRPRQALDQHRASVALALDLFGENSPEWMHARIREADSLSRIDPEAAERLFTELIERGVALGWQDRPVVLYAQFGLAELLRRQSRWETAQVLLEDALDRANEQPAADARLLVARLQSALQSVHTGLSDLQAAADFGEAALAGYQQLYGADSLQAGAAALRLAETRVAAAAFDAAAALFGQALAVYRSHLGYRAELTAAVHLKLAGALILADDPEAAELQFLDLIQSVQAAQGQAYLDWRERPLMAAMGGLVRLKIGQGRWSDALSWSVQAVDRAQVDLRRAHPQGFDDQMLIRALHDHGRLLLVNGDFGAASEMLRQSWSRLAARGSERWRVARDLAFAEALSGRDQDAQALVAGITDDPDTRDSGAVSFALLALMRGDLAEAQQFLDLTGEPLESMYSGVAHGVIQVLTGDAQSGLDRIDRALQGGSPSAYPGDDSGPIERLLLLRIIDAVLSGASVPRDATALTTELSRLIDPD